MPAPEGFLNVNQVATKLGKSRATVYRMIKGGQFPAPFQIGAAGSVWSEDDVSGYLTGMERKPLARQQQ